MRGNLTCCLAAVAELELRISDEASTTTERGVKKATSERRTLYETAGS